jgi:hypothetical protein
LASLRYHFPTITYHHRSYQTANEFTWRFSAYTDTPLYLVQQ